MNNDATIKETRMRLIEARGRISQDLGAGRMVGMILVYFISIGTGMFIGQYRREVAPVV